MQAGLTQFLRQASTAADSRGYDPVLEFAMDRLVQLVRRTLRRNPRVRRWEETDDVVQEAAMRLTHALQDVRPGTTVEFFGLALVQVRRTLIDLARRHLGPNGTSRIHEFDPSFSLDGDQNNADGPASLAEWTEFHESVGHLPPEEREVVECVFYGGATYEDVATLQGVSRRTVIRRMNSARLRLARAVPTVVSITE